MTPAEPTTENTDGRNRSSIRELRAVSGKKPLDLRPRSAPSAPLRASILISKGKTRSAQGRRGRGEKTLPKMKRFRRLHCKGAEAQRSEFQLSDFILQSCPLRLCVLATLR